MEEIIEIDVRNVNKDFYVIYIFIYLPKNKKKNIG